MIKAVLGYAKTRNGVTVAVKISVKIGGAVITADGSPEFCIKGNVICKLIIGALFSYSALCDGNEIVLSADDIGVILCT